MNSTPEQGAEPRRSDESAFVDPPSVSRTCPTRALPGARRAPVRRARRAAPRRARPRPRRAAGDHVRPTIGAPADYTLEEDGVVSLRFENRLAGYPGWFWTVSLARVEGDDPTVLEVELLPGDGALLAPDWVPWAVRLADYQAAQLALAESRAEGVEDDEARGRRRPRRRRRPGCRRLRRRRIPDPARRRRRRRRHRRARRAGGRRVTIEERRGVRRRAEFDDDDDVDEDESTTTTRPTESD